MLRFYTLRDDVLANLGRLLQALDLYVKPLYVCIFRPKLKLDALYHLLKYLRLSFDILATLICFRQFFSQLLCILLFQFDKLCLQVFTFIHRLQVESFELVHLIN